MDYLVIASLQEGRVDCHKRCHAFASQSSGKRDGMLLGNADVEGAAVEALLEAVHAGAAAHSGMDADDAAVPLSFSYQSVGKEVGVRGDLQPIDKTLAATAKLQATSHS